MYKIHHLLFSVLKFHAPKHVFYLLSFIVSCSSSSKAIAIMARCLVDKCLNIVLDNLCWTSCTSNLLTVTLFSCLSVYDGMMWILSQNVGPVRVGAVRCRSASVSSVWIILYLFHQYKKIPFLSNLRDTDEYYCIFFFFFGSWLTTSYWQQNE